MRSTVGILNEVRARESMVDDYLGPVEDMFNLLSAYDVRLDKEEIDLVSDLLPLPLPLPLILPLPLTLTLPLPLPLPLTR